MLLRRLGNKQIIAKEIIKYFPEHDIYIDFFFGAGGIFFNKQQVRYNYLNDIDNNIYNCFDVLLRHKKELITYINLIPYHSEFWQECKTRKPDNNVEKAVYFLVLSNFGYMGMPQTLHFKSDNSKKILLQNLEKTYLFLVRNENKFLNCDFREVLKKISFRSEKEKTNAFIYADPPYLDTLNNYECSFTEQDSIDLFNVLQNSGIRWAMSEFKNDFIIKQTRERGLNVITIGERRTMKNRNTEILITNYKENKTLFD